MSSLTYYNKATKTVYSIFIVSICLLTIIAIGITSVPTILKISGTINMYNAAYGDHSFLTLYNTTSLGYGMSFSVIDIVILAILLFGMLYSFKKRKKSRRVYIAFWVIFVGILFYAVSIILSLLSKYTAWYEYADPSNKFFLFEYMWFTWNAIYLLIAATVLSFSAPITIFIVMLMLLIYTINPANHTTMNRKINNMNLLK